MLNLFQILSPDFVTCRHFGALMNVRWRTNTATPNGSAIPRPAAKLFRVNSSHPCLLELSGRPFTLFVILPTNKRLLSPTLDSVHGKQSVPARTLWYIARHQKCTKRIGAAVVRVSGDLREAPLKEVGITQQWGRVQRGPCRSKPTRAQTLRRERIHLRIELPSQRTYRRSH